MVCSGVCDWASLGVLEAVPKVQALSAGSATHTGSHAGSKHEHAQPQARPCLPRNRMACAQALMLSMVDPAVLPHVHPERGCAKDALAPLVAWFSGALRQLRPEEPPDVDLVRPQQSRNPETSNLPLWTRWRKCGVCCGEVLRTLSGSTSGASRCAVLCLWPVNFAGACLAGSVCSAVANRCANLFAFLMTDHLEDMEAGAHAPLHLYVGLLQEHLPAASGLPGAIERLRAAAAARAGTGEELVLLLVALLRALGLQARSARCGLGGDVQGA